MTTQVSRRDTTARKVGYLGQLSLGAQPGRAAWTRAALALRVAESRPDRALVASIVRERHYLQRAAVPPRTLVLSYLADLRGVGPGDAGAAAMAQVALLPGNFPVYPTPAPAPSPNAPRACWGRSISWSTTPASPATAPCTR